MYTEVQRTAPSELGYIDQVGQSTRRWSLAAIADALGLRQEVQALLWGSGQVALRQGLIGE